MKPSGRIAVASDNWSPAHPDLIAALGTVNEGPAPAYGSDAWTTAAAKAFAEQFGRRARVYFTFGGTGANVLAISSMLTGSHEAVLCSAASHVLTDEAGALARFAGTTLLPVATDDAKLTVPALESAMKQFVRGEHQVLPSVLTITNATETGRAYSAPEVRALTDWAHARGLMVHMDGARLANAAVHNGTSLHEISIGAGVDVLTLGGTKNGLMFGEAIVVAASRARVPESRIRHVRKQAGQLASKQRFIAAQFQTYLQSGLWESNATQANRAARQLADGLGGLTGAQLAYPVEANMLFVDLSPQIRSAMAEVADFYVYDEERGRCRLVCSFDTRPADIAHVIAAAKAKPSTRSRRAAATRTSSRGVKV